ncbi:hypothetical protein AX17_004865 [Amanita inopinata Kibby_2008]|nr:hypothetical protein AX17_004865 [Amanita inopinata Kibby_2008]
MPRENRKRGKKHKKNPEEQDNSGEKQPVTEPSGSPSWMRSAERAEEHNPEAPYGYVDNDVKAYFRTVDVQIRDWQENRDYDDGDEDKDPNEDRHLFFVAALSEMSGKEKQLATDPDCSVILERMAHSMDDFVRRVFADSLAGSFERLSKHRFASHVCQTMFAVARDTVSREIRGVMPDVPEASDHGELRTLTRLILDICEELLPCLGSLIMDPFASHVVRSLLLLLTPNLASDDSPNSSLRSKKSSHWKAKQGTMKSVFTDEKGKGKESAVSSVPAEFRQMARRFVKTLRAELGDNEIRAFAASKVASPALKMLIEVEAIQGMAGISGSLLDCVTMGVVSACLDDPSVTTVERSDYVGTLLRDATSSHLLEAIVTHCPDHVFSVLWSTYFSGKLPRLAVHPVANFVVSRAIDRVSATQLSEACEELDGTWNKLLQSTRVVVLRVIVDRAAKLQSSEDVVGEAICSAFELTTADEKKQLVPCVLHLMTLKDYQSNKPRTASEKTGKFSKTQGREGANSNMEPTNHGSQLLQALLRLSEPHNELVIASIDSLSVDERIKLAHNSYSSRVYDVLLESASVTPKAKRKFVMDFIGSYHLLVDDKIGSHVVDRCWDFADTYLKERIARSLISYDQVLAASYYGRFFARNLNLQLLQRRPDNWRDMQAERKKQKEGRGIAAATSPQKQATEKTVSDTVAQPEKSAKKAMKRRRESREEDEIDNVFNSAIGKKIKRAALGTDDTKAQEQATPAKQEDAYADMKTILDAIKTAPNHDGGPRKKKNKASK